MKISYLIAGITVMVISVVLFAIGFGIAVVHKTSGIPTAAVILIILAVFLLAVTSLLVFLGLTKGDFFETEQKEK